MDNFESNEFISSNTEPNISSNINQTSEFSGTNDVPVPPEVNNQYGLEDYSQPQEDTFYGNQPIYTSPVIPQNSYIPTPPPPPQKKDKKRHSTATVILSVILAALIGFGGCIAAMYFFKDKLIDSQSSKGDTSQGENGTFEGGSTNVNISIDENMESIAQAVAKKASNSVVGIRVVANNNFTTSVGEGSGVVYSEDGYIITNYHVIKAAVQYSNAKIDVFFGDITTEPYAAAVVGYNISSDLAVIKIDAKNLKKAELGDSEKLEVGQYVVTIGSPGGLEFMGSVTYGIISGLDRQVSSDSKIGLIQTDAAINPGNSGGALLDSTGKLIGINSSKIVSEEFEGMGFAIPINKTKQICDDIIANKDKPEPYIGISIDKSYPAGFLEYYGYPSGAVVYSVASDSPASRAGIRKNDIITKFDGQSVADYNELFELIRGCVPGDRVDVVIYRGGRYLVLNVIVDSES